MKLTVSQKDLAEAVLNIQRAVSTKSTVPALESAYCFGPDREH